MTRVSNPFKSRRGPSSPLFIAVVVLLVVYTVAQSLLVEKEEIAEAVTDERQTPAPKSFVSGGITVHREMIDGRDVLWASPQDNQKGEIKGLLFLAHGCGHSNLDWFSKHSEGCEDCKGLPEEASIVQMALDLGLVAIATSSTNWRTKCWSGFDVTPTALVLNELWHRFSQTETLPTTNSTAIDSGSKKNAPRLPVYAFGASSGGSFVSTLASPLQSRFGIRLDGFVSQIAAKPTSPKQQDKEPKNLCKVYITMNKDAKTDSAAKDRVEKCQSKDNKKHHKCKHIQLPHLPIPPNYFSDRIQEVSENESFDIVKVLTRGGFIRPDNGELYQDPRETHANWSRALQQASHEKHMSLEFEKRGDALLADQSPIFEVLNVAWGYHEMSREGVKEALEFCLERPEPTTAATK